MPVRRRPRLLAALAGAALLAAAAPGASALAAQTAESVPLALTKHSSGDVAISTDGAFAIAAGDDAVQRVALTPGRMALLGGTEQAGGRTVELHPRGRHAYVLNRTGGALHVLDVRGARPRLLRTLGLRRLAPDLAADLAVAPRGDALYVAYLGGLQVLSLARPGEPRRLATVPRPTEQYEGSIVVEPGGRQVVGAVSHGTRDYLLRYDVRRPARPRALGGPAAMPFAPHALAFDPSGRRLYVAGDSGVGTPGSVAKLRAGDLHVLARRGDLPQQPRQLAVSPDGDRLVTAASVTIDQPGIGVLDAGSLAPIGFSEDFAWPDGLTISQAGVSRGRAYFIRQADDADMAGETAVRTFTGITLG